MEERTQVVVIHGGGEFVSDSYEGLLRELAQKTPNLDRMRQRGGWKSNLQDDLGDHYDVVAPRMPQPDTPMYDAWKLWFEKVIPLLNNEVILVGHSLGGIFLARYLSEHAFPKKVVGLFLVAASYNDRTHPFSHSGFIVSDDFSKLDETAETIVLYHSTDDPVVPYASFEMYQGHIPRAIGISFNDRKHFNDEHFPELVRDIKEL